VILRKPYAFLIKYFRLIHFAIILLLGLVINNYSNVVSFFNNYIANNYSTTIRTGLETIYVPINFLILLILAIGLIITILTLLLHKKKPVKLYIFMTVYYILLFLGLLYIRGVLAGIEEELLASTLARSIRDILILSYAPQFIFIVFAFIRGIGFNIKKFDFANDLKEMNYNYKDAEEFELNINLDTYKARRKIHRAGREFVYYIKENKFIVICLSIILFVIGVVYIINNTTGNYDVTYKTGREFIYNNLNINVLDSMITNLDYQGNVISEDAYYLVLKMQINNNSGKSIKMDYNNFKLAIGNELIVPSVTDSSFFFDYAPSDVPLMTSHRSEKIFNLVYKLDKKQINKAMKLEIYNGSVYEKGEYIYKHIYVTLKPNTIGNLEMNNNFRVNEPIKFDDTYLGNTSLNITSYNITKSYLYQYEKCNSNGTCNEYSDKITTSLNGFREESMLLVMEADYLIDKNTLYAKSYTSLNKFINNFASLQYKINEKKLTDFVNLTPSNVDNLIILEVPSNIINASSIQLIFQIRNQKYVVNLKY